MKDSVRPQSGHIKRKRESFLIHSIVRPVYPGQRPEADKTVTREARDSETVNILFTLGCARTRARQVDPSALLNTRVNSWLFFPRELVIKSFITDRLPIKLRPPSAEYIKDALMNNLTTVYTRARRARSRSSAERREREAVPRRPDHQASLLDNLFCIFRPARIYYGTRVRARARAWAM